MRKECLRHSSCFRTLLITLLSRRLCRGARISPTPPVSVRQGTESQLRTCQLTTKLRRSWAAVPDGLMNPSYISAGEMRWENEHGAVFVETECGFLRRKGASSNWSVCERNGNYPDECADVHTPRPKSNGEWSIILPR